MAENLRFEAATRLSWPPINERYTDLDLDFHYGSNIGADELVVEESVFNPLLSDIVKSFHHNIDGIISLLMMPVSIFRHAQGTERLAISVMMSGAPLPGSDGERPVLDIKTDSPEFEAWQKDAIERYDHRRNKGGLWIPYSNSLHNYRGFADKHDELLSPPGKYLDAFALGLHGVLCASLVSAWTAVEILMTDLWIKAVDLRPATLPRNFLKAFDASNKKPSIGLLELEKYGFDLSNNMGKVLSDTKAIKRESLHGLIEAYNSTFVRVHNGKPRTSNTLEFITARIKTELAPLESIRNLLAHRGGLVDRAFLDQVASVPELASLTENSAFQANGEMVCKYLNSTIRRGFDLIGFVGKWLDENPT